MLVQSTAPGADAPARIELLPALPKEWPSGSLAGARARGGFEIKMKWQGGELVNAEIHNTGPQASVDVAYGNKTAQTDARRRGEPIAQRATGRGQGDALIRLPDPFLF